MSPEDLIGDPRKRLRRRKISGGITPDPCKANSLRSRIMPMPLPAEFILPLQQYDGTHTIPLVKAGDTVLKYQVLTRPENATGTPLHAPSSGTITAIGTMPVCGLPGASAICIQLQCDGNDDSLELHACSNPAQLTSFEILRKIEAAGIVGMGGAGFPSALKISLAIEHGTELLIINAAECEPYISCDEALIRERADAVVMGASLLRTACRAPRCVIAIEKDKKDAISALRAALAHSPIELMLLQSIYPTGSEKQIIQAVTGLEVPAGGHPVQLGILVQNVGTAYAVYQAVAEGKPSVSRIITLTGKALQTPKNFEALIGTPINFLLDLCGVDRARHRATVMGGSLMGIELERKDVPITKTSNCLIAATGEEFPQQEPALACIRCGFCVDVCPSQLQPQQLYNFARTHNHAQLQSYGLQDCIECGACDYVCPSHIPLVQYYVIAKQEMRDVQVQHKQSHHWQARFQLHQYRTRKAKDSARDRRNQAVKIASDSPTPTIATFSRTAAQQEIADAVARAKARKVAAQQFSKAVPSEEQKDNGQGSSE